MSKKLYIYSIIFAVTYFLFIAHSVYQSANNMIGGAKFAIREKTEAPLVLSKFALLEGCVVPTDGIVTFPSYIVNQKTGEKVRMEIREMFLFIQDIPDNIPFYIRLMKNSAIGLIWICFGIFIYLPFAAYKLMKSIPKNEFYSLKNINRLRRISYLSLLIWLLLILSEFFLGFSNSAYMQPEGYRFITGGTSAYNYPLLFIGLIILILSEILRYTTHIKEEQDLTI